MRVLLFVVALAALGCKEDGAHLTLVAPEGPETASSFRVVLATPEQVPQIGNQRVGTSNATQTVAYYLQRTVAGEQRDAIARVDGLRVRIEPDASLSTHFIPFVLVYDAEGAIVGIGTFHGDGQTTPSPINVLPEQIGKYSVDVEPVTEVGDLAEPAAGQVQVIECARDQGAFTSGIVWRPKRGGELRLVFPDDDGLDATGRKLDLDCDDHEVTAESSGRDCDDTRSAFHRDAPEECDGLDTNCDGLTTLAVGCDLTNTTCGGMQGVSVCNDRTGTETACQPGPSCACMFGLPGCARCTLGFMATVNPGSVTPCQPGLGYLHTQEHCSSLAPCTVEVLGVRGGWKVEVSADLTGATGFSTRIANIADKFAVRAKRPEGAGVEIAGEPGGATGEADIALIAPDGAVHYLGVQLQLAEQPQICQGSGPHAMYCVP